MLSKTKSRLSADKAGFAGKTLFTFFIAFLMLQITLLAQEGWFQQTNGTTDHLRSIYFVDKYTGWATGDGGIFFTIDGGENWNRQYTGECQGVFFINSITGWVIGGPSGLLKTTNGGADWIAKPIISSCLWNIYFIDENIGWATGPYVQFCYPLIIQKTTDGGESWMELQDGDGTALYFIDSNVGWYVDYGDPQFGTPGIIYKTINGGQSFFPQDTAYAPMDVCFADSDNGWVAGGGEIMRTTNGGDYWEQISLGVGNLTSVDFIDSNIGWTVGYNGVILHTTNGGIDWYEQESGVNEYLLSVCFIDSVTGWAVGGNGTILHTTNGGVSSVDEEEINKLPTDFNLTQNYPNPFNPSTKIRYSVPQTSDVVIKIFDVLGNEIETLVNEEKSGGIYEITWYADNLPSGVYFYQLQTGNFIDTKKMILLK